MIQKRDQLRLFLRWAVEAYNVATDPPACNYSRSIDAHERDDINQFSRAYLLRLSIDVKWIVADLLVKLPKRRAKVLHSWLQDESEYSWAQLTYRQRTDLKRDRATLADRLRAGIGI